MGTWYLFDSIATEEHGNPFSLREKAGMRGYKIRRLSCFTPSP
jgi:hypothetical protein